MDKWIQQDTWLPSAGAIEFCDKEVGAAKLVRDTLNTPDIFDLTRDDYRNNCISSFCQANSIISKMISDAQDYDEKLQRAIDKVNKDK